MKVPLIVTIPEVVKLVILVIMGLTMSEINHQNIL